MGASLPTTGEGTKAKIPREVKKTDPRGSGIELEKNLGAGQLGDKLCATTSKREGSGKSKGSLSNSEVKGGGCQRSPSLLSLRNAISFGTPAPSRRRRFTRLSATIHLRSQSEGTFRPALVVSAPAEGFGGCRLRPAPPLAPSGGQAKGRGWGRWRRTGAWSGHIKTEGAAAGLLTQYRCLGAVVTAPLLLGGCPRQGPASVVSSAAAAQVSPPTPSFKGARMRGPRMPRALLSGGPLQPRGA